MKVKVAFIGIGGYARQTIKDLLLKKGSEIKAVAAVDPYACSSEIYNIIKDMCPVFENMDEMFCSLRKENYPDLTVITTPIQYHTEQIKIAVEHGSNVICEKPMTGDASDLTVLKKLSESSDKFIAIGYQWSFSEAIGKLKRDVKSGKLGKPLMLKGLVLWPRDENYFTRSTGWAGKVRALNGRRIIDSIANNATAHFFHNIFYILGDKTDGSATATDIRGNLLRVNDIETFDNATIKFKVCGADCFMAVAHSTKSTCEPVFSYRFENAVIDYPDENGNIVAKLNDGKTVVYGNPFEEGPAYKIIKCIDYIKKGIKDIDCGVDAASAHVEFIDELYNNSRVYTVNPDVVVKENGLSYITDFDEIMKNCYNENKNLCETDQWEKITGGNL